MQFKVKPWAHQLRAIEQARGRDCFALFFEQGCGKTSTLINILRQKYMDEGMLSTLILCPQIVVENWRREFLQYSDISEYEIYTLTGEAFRRLCDFERFIECKPRRIVITNYEALNMQTLFQKKLLPWAPEVVVLDESHKCKDYTAKRTKRSLELGKTAKFRYILSGTPIVNSAFDIFTQFQFLDKGETFSPDYRIFREEYFRDWNANRPRQNYFPDWRPKQGALEAMNAKIYKKAMRVRKSECLDLPPFIRQVIDVSFGEEQGKAYREMERDCVTYYKQEVISADLAIKKALRLQQIVTGFVTTDDGNCKVYEKNPRIDALEEVLTQIGPNHKVIIWAVFKQNYEAIRRLLQRMKIYFVEVHGDVSAPQKQANIDAFNHPSGPVRVLIGHPASCGIGVNLTIADYAVFYSRSFSLEYDLQAEARNYRGGSEQHKSITRIDLVTSHSIDEVVITALQNKQDVSEIILKYMKGK